MIQKAREFVVPIFDVKVSILIGSPQSVENYLQDVHNRVFGHSAPNVVAETFYSLGYEAFQVECNGYSLTIPLGFEVQYSEHNHCENCET